MRVPEGKMILFSQLINCAYSFVQHIMDIHIDSKQSMKAVKHRGVTSGSEVTELPAVLR